MTAAGIAALLDIMIRIVALAPSLATSYQKIVDALHQTGEITTDEWEARKAEYLSAMNDASWQTDSQPQV